VNVYFYRIIFILTRKNIIIINIPQSILRQKIIFFPIAEGDARIVEVFRVKNHDFTPKNHIFANFRRDVRHPNEKVLLILIINMTWMKYYE
jgi:hypothetical protein